jgi:hypothetical protein
MVEINFFQTKKPAGKQVFSKILVVPTRFELVSPP